MNSLIHEVTERIIDRSKLSRQAYLDKISKARRQGPHREILSCGNLAHGFAACSTADKNHLRSMNKPNIAIVSAYNDMLSAHQPYKNFPDIIKQAVDKAGAVAQFAGGVPAMCDGITQGNPGMDLSLMSRDVIAMSTAVALSHNMFDGAAMLGICDKIVPGLLIGALNFGHLPTVFVPAGPMSSGLPNKEKARIRQKYAQGIVGQDELLKAESESYHSPGTCTFYGTANSNQLIIEIMGLHLPGASFVHPNSALREALTKAAAEQVTSLTDLGEKYMPIGHIIDVKAIVNGLVALLATGGSTNHTMHLVAIAKAAGYVVNWDDFSDISNAVPLLTHIYPNGSADINDFTKAGGMALLVKELLDAKLLHNDVNTICGHGLELYTKVPCLEDGELTWSDGPTQSKNTEVLAPVSKPFKPDGGLSVLHGNLGRAVMKTSALKTGHVEIKAPAVVLEDQYEFAAAFKAGKLDKDCVIVVRFQGPSAIGMPELHSLSPPLGVLQDKGFHVVLVTDGRMSGASGKVPAAIHVTPEAYKGGLLAKVCDGDLIELNTHTGDMHLLVDEEELANRKNMSFHNANHQTGMGREMFAAMRHNLSGAEQGACSLFAERSQSD
jgi:phosphogluconate dehydratase